MNKFSCTGQYKPSYTHEGHISVQLNGEFQIPLMADDIKNWCSTCQNADALKQIIAACRRQIQVLNEQDDDDFRSRA